MSRQIQIRRGSATEHQNFTGAVGEITMDTTNNTLRVHDGETVGGVTLAKREDIPSDIMNADYVIEYQAPTAENGYTWYRKYKSGWVEQGGRIKGGFAQSIGWNTKTVSLPVPMYDNSYINTFQATWNFSYGGQSGQDKIYATADSTNTKMVLSYILLSSSQEMRVIWRIEGFSK